MGIQKGVGGLDGAEWAEKKKVLLDKQSSGAGKQPKVGGKGGCKIFFTNPEPTFTGKTRNGKGWEMWSYNVNMDI